MKEKNGIALLIGIILLLTVGMVSASYESQTWDEACLSSCTMHINDDTTFRQRMINPVHKCQEVCAEWKQNYGVERE